MERIERGLFGVFWTLALAWIFVCAWSFWAAEAGPLDDWYFGARDVVQPRGYALGSLRHAPTWALFNLALGALPPGMLFGLRSLLRRR